MHQKKDGGAHINDKMAAGMWHQSWKYWLELEVIRQALSAFKEDLKGKRVLVICDKSVVAYINKQGEHDQRDCSLSPKSFASCVVL